MFHARPRQSRIFSEWMPSVTMRVVASKRMIVLRPRLTRPPSVSAHRNTLSVRGGLNRASERRWEPIRRRKTFAARQNAQPSQ